MPKNGEKAGDVDHEDTDDYNEEVDDAPEAAGEGATKKKKKRKPRKKKNETWEQYSQRVANWEASRPPEVELRITGAHMTQKYYTKKLLPEYIQAIGKARLRDESKSYYLQEDGNSSHGTKSFGNVAYTAKEMNWIDRIVHPA